MSCQKQEYLWQCAWERFFTTKNTLIDLRTNPYSEDGQTTVRGPHAAHKVLFAARQKLLGSKNNIVYDIVLFVYDILIDIVLFITVSHYVTSFPKCICFSSSSTVYYYLISLQ